MKFSYKILLILSIFIGFFIIQAKSSQEIKETTILNRFLGENYQTIKEVLRISHNMQYEAEPFQNRKHRERFRFAPADNNPRRVMIKARQLAAKFKTINGILYHSDLPNKKLLFEQLLESSESLSTYGKRAVRAIRDNNYALYLASAQGIENEVFHMSELITSLESAINLVIGEFDAEKEAL